jgi:hypothetical protein
LGAIVVLAATTYGGWPAAETAVGAAGSGRGVADRLVGGLDGLEGLDGLDAGEAVGVGETSAAAARVPLAANRPMVPATTSRTNSPASASATGERRRDRAELITTL